MSDAEGGLESLIPSVRFFQRFGSSDFTNADRRRIVRALELLDSDERHPSLRVHQLHGDLEGHWSASASDELRITFRRLSGGRKLLVSCSRHYQR
jgi:mRNA-degrading endonuclease YafQ of YafQ-DinJ toxin-antitoxin module